jgi:hypothetical protein
MTAYFVDLTAPKQRALIASDSLGYTVTGDRHRPLGFVDKIIACPARRGALIGAGIYDIHVAAGAALMGRPELMSFEDVIEALPGILRVETERLANERAIDTNGLMLFAGGWVGWNDADGKFELVVFESHKDDYAPQRGAKGLIGIPNVPPAYVPPGFNQIADPAVRAMAGLRSIDRFLRDHAADFGMAPIGGEIVLSELRPDGIATRVVGRLDGFETLGEEIAETWNDVYAGNGDFSGVDLVNRTAGQEGALRKFEAIARRTAPAGDPTAPPIGELSRQQRRHAEKMARKAGKRAA